LGDLFLEGSQNYPDEIMERAIKSAIGSQKAVALLCGSALKNKGIQPLMDAIVKYLPHPSDEGVVGKWQD